MQTIIVKMMSIFGNNILKKIIILKMINVYYDNLLNISY